jgi:O-Antigen ligase
MATAPLTSPYHRIVRLLIWVYCLSWSFDYRGTETGGSPVQFAFFGLALVCSAGVAIIGWKGLLVRPVGWILFMWGSFLVFSLGVVILNHVPMSNFLRNIAPQLLVCSSLCITQVAAAMGFSWQVVVTPTLIAGVVNGFWKAFYAIAIGGRDIETIRIELLSPGQPFLLSVMMLALTLRREIPWVPMLVGSTALMAYLISVTRSVVFIIIAAAFGCFMALYGAWRMNQLKGGFFQKKFIQVIIAVAVLTFTAVATAVVSPVVYERWETRLFHTEGGERTQLDPSALTRLAEIKSFRDIMAQNPLTYIYGCGMGHPYYWDESYMQELAYTYYIPDFRQAVSEVWFPGHSVWTYAIFTGGIIGLLAYMGILIGPAWVAWRTAWLIRVVPEFGVETAFLPLVAQLAYLSQTMTFNPMIDRTGGIVLGLVAGLPQFIAMAAWRKEKAALRHSHRANGF